MKLHALDIPDESPLVAKWLESHLVGLDLAELIAELTQVHGQGLSLPGGIREMLGPDQAAVLSSGLSALSPEKLQVLLRQPGLLAELQQWVLSEGSPYWQELLDRQTALDRPLSAGRGDLLRWIDGVDRYSANEDSRIVAIARKPLAWYRRPTLAALATAAALLLAFFIFEGRRAPADPRSPQLAAAWGWNKDGQLPSDMAADAYLEQLADAAQAWFNKRPTDAREIAQRIIELRQGCSKLLLAEHKPLPPRHREWLVEHCYRWAAKLDTQLSAVEHGEDPLAVRSQTDDMVRRIVESLRSRAQQAHDA